MWFLMIVFGHSDYISLPYARCCFYRSGAVEEHVTEPATKNKFLTELEQVDAAQLEQQVKCYMLFRMIKIQLCQTPMLEASLDCSIQ